MKTRAINIVDAGETDILKILAKSGGLLALKGSDKGGIEVEEANRDTDAGGVVDGEDEDEMGTGLNAQNTYANFQEEYHTFIPAHLILPHHDDYNHDNNSTNTN